MSATPSNRLQARASERLRASRRGFVQDASRTAVTEMLERSGVTGRWSARIWQGRSMRTPERRDAPAHVDGTSTRKARSIHGKGVPTTPPAGVVALTRMGFGLRAGDLDAFNALGANDDARLNAYIEQQLDPASIDDSVFDTRIASSGFTTLSKSVEQLWADHVVPDPDYEVRLQPLHEIESLTLLRAAYSRRQLVEVLADFWHNHFNIFADWDTGPLWVHYDRDVIRNHLLGNFRQMLEACATSPPMLHYLDNLYNSADGPNENYSRELFELHTLGADSYLGVVPQNTVPVDGDGNPVGWVDDDIKAAARCLTGWTASMLPWIPEIGDTGSFLYYDPWHDHTAKQVLGANLPANQAAMKDGRDVLDLLAAHPATGRFIATKLCRRLIGDQPSQTVIDAAAAEFTAHVASADQLERVVRTILTSQDFRSTWAEKVKRPFEIAIGAIRATGADFSFRLDDNNTGTFFYLYNHTGQTLFGHRAPNGYPDVKEDWQTTSPRVMSWRVTNWLIDARDSGNVPLFDAVGQTPAHVRSSNALADFWIDRVLGRPMPDAERAEIVAFMAQGRNPALDWPLDTDTDAQDRLRAMVGLIFMSPAFLWR